MFAGSVPSPALFSPYCPMNDPSSLNLHGSTSPYSSRLSASSSNRCFSGSRSKDTLGGTPFLSLKVQHKLIKQATQPNGSVSAGNTLTHQHSYTSTLLHINTPTHQHSYTSTLLYINTLTHQHSYTSTHQHSYTSTLLHFHACFYLCIFSPFIDIVKHCIHWYIFQKSQEKKENA